MSKIFQIDTDTTLTVSLSSYWNLNQASDDRFDAFGTNDLTDATSTGSDTGKVFDAAAFVAASSNLLSHTSTSDLSAGVGDQAISIACWVKLSSKSSDMWIVSKIDTTRGVDYVLWYDSVADRLRFRVQNTNVSADNLGSPALDTWYFVVCWHNVSGSQLLHIKVNGGTENSISYSPGPFSDVTNSSNDFRIGGRGISETSTLFYDGLVDELGFWKKVLSAQEQTDLYNGGSGQTLLNVQTQTLDSDVTILSVQATETIDSDTSLTLYLVDMLAKLKAEDVSDADKDSEIVVSHTTPSNPTLVSATDLKYGDTVRLVYTGTAPAYNIYRKTTAMGSYVKVNGFPIADTTYDVGGLTVNIDYTFKVRGVNGAGTESADSNTLTATPTLDLSIGKFSAPTWAVIIEGDPEPRAILANVSLSYGSDVSTATFTIQDDLNTGVFPSYDEAVDVQINSKTILVGTIKGITDNLTNRGIGKTFTVLEGIESLRKTSVDPTVAEWNTQRGVDNIDANKVKADAILQAVLGYIPEGTPQEFPGQVHLNDMTLLEAAETVLRKLGNYRVFFNRTTEEIEVYQFGQGGDTTHAFVPGGNIISYNITDNRQDVVDQVTVLGPPRAIRVRKDIVDLESVPDENGVYHLSFVLDGVNIRDIVVEGSQRARPVIEQSSEIKVLPEDMGILPAIGSNRSFWPYQPLADFGNTRNDDGFRPAVRGLITPALSYSSVSTRLQYLDQNRVRIFIGDIPKIWLYSLITHNVDRTKLGIPGNGGISVTILSALQWVAGAIRVTYTEDGERSSVTTGSGDVQRTITDSQYQIVIDNIGVDTFDNEDEITQLMTDRAVAEYARLHKSQLNGQITVIGNEDIGLKSTVVVNSEKLDVVRVDHDFSSGFTTSVTLTNEPFVSAINATPTPRDDKRRTAERKAAVDARIQFEDAAVDKNVTTQRELDYQRKIGTPGDRSAAWQD